MTSLYVFPSVPQLHGGIRSPVALQSKHEDLSHTTPFLNLTVAPDSSILIVVTAPHATRSFRYVYVSRSFWLYLQSRRGDTSVILGLPSGSGGPIPFCRTFCGTRHCHIVVPSSTLPENAPSFGKLNLCRTLESLLEVHHLFCPAMSF